MKMLICTVNLKWVSQLAFPTCAQKNEFRENNHALNSNKNNSLLRYQYKDPHTSVRINFSFSMSLNRSSVFKLFFPNIDDVCK